MPVDFGEKYRYRKMPEYIPGTGSHDDYVRFYYVEGEGERILNANVDFVLQGLRQGNCSSKGIDILTPSEILQIIFRQQKSQGKTNRSVHRRKCLRNFFKGSYASKQRKRRLSQLRWPALFFFRILFQSFKQPIGTTQTPSGLLYPY